MLGIFLTIGFITIAPEALMILAPNAKDYWVAKWVIPPVALGTLAQYFYTNYVNLELFHKKTPLIALSSIFAAIVNYLLNYIAIPRFGYIAAAYTTLLSYIFLMFFHYIATVFVLKEKVYKDSFMFIGLAISVLLSLTGIMYFYKDGLTMAVLRYTVALIGLGIFAFIRKNDIIALYGYLKKKYIKKD